MPFKLHSKGRRHIPCQRHRVTNWREYDAALRNRGSLTIWFTPDAIAGWKAQPRATPEAASLFGPGHRNRADFASGVSIGASPRRGHDRLDHGVADDRPARPRAYDAEPAGVWIVDLQISADRRERPSLIVDSTGLKLRAD
jgi:hypothetical protein